jgi:hypothetical protein
LAIHPEAALFAAEGQNRPACKATENSNYFTSLCAVCFLHELQNFFVSKRSECFFLFFVVV